MTDRFTSNIRPSVTIFTSPKAGSGLRNSEVPRLVELLKEASIAVEVTHDPERLTEIAKSYPEQNDGEATTGSHTNSGLTPIVVAAGGDGTITLAATRLSLARNSDRPNHHADIPLIPMPLGTENLLAGYFGHDADAEHVLQTLRHGQVAPLDLGIANGKPFLTMVTCGFDAEVIRALHFRRRGHIRRMTYAGPIARAMRRYAFPKLEVSVEDPDTRQWKKIHCGWAMVFNLPCYAAGLPIEPDAKGDDGLLDVITFKGGSVLCGFRYLAGIIFGRHVRFADVTRIRTRRIRVTSKKPVPCQADGDYFGRLPLEVELRSHAIKLLVPPSPSDLPS